MTTNRPARGGGKKRDDARAFAWIDSGFEKQLDDLRAILRIENVGAFTRPDVLDVPTEQVDLVVDFVKDDGAGRVPAAGGEVTTRCQAIRSLPWNRRRSLR